jgi:hypothetical protein
MNRVELITVIGLLTVLESAPGQSISKRLPTFEEFPIREIFHGTPYSPILLTPEQHRYRTRIREGVEKGWGVLIGGTGGNEQQRPGPNFAGQYAVISWGCGAPCLMMAVSDLKTGTVLDPPLAAKSGQLALPLLVFPYRPGMNAEIEYRLNSRLMIIKATPHYWERLDARAYAFYFLLQDGKWKLLRRVPITDE